MSLLSSLRSTLSTLFRRASAENDTEEELRAHVQNRADDLERSGLARAEAERRARIEFGAHEKFKEECREATGAHFLRTLFQDLRFGARMLRKSPGFTAIAVLTLALGIGANTAIFSLIDVILMRPLPIRDSGRVVVLKWMAHKQPRTDGYGSFGFCHIEEHETGAAGCSFSYPFFDDLRTHTPMFSHLTAFAGSPNLHLDRNGERTRINAPLVSGEFFETLGLRAALGRTLESSDDNPGVPAVAVLAYGYWQNAFGGDRSILGKTIYLDRSPVTIVGVAAPDFEELIPGRTWDMCLPLSFYPRLNLHWAEGLNDNASWWLTIVGRLQPGVSPEQAQTAVSQFFRNEMLRGAKAFSEEDEPRVSLLPVQTGIVGNRWLYEKPFYLLMAAVGIVLLIACSNVSGLMLARAASRQKEVAVRLALGGSRTRIIRQLLTESVLLSLAGGAIGVLVAYWSLAALRSSDWLGSIHDFAVKPDARLLFFAVSVSVLSGILPGLLPALRATRLDLTPTLKESALTLPNISQNGRRFLLGNALVVAQVTLSILVLAGAGLLVRTLLNLKGINPGFDTRNLLLVGIDLKEDEYSKEQAQNLYRELQIRLSAVPSVTSVSYSSDALLSGSLWTTRTHIEDQKQSVNTDILSVDSHFFETLRIPLLAGRAFRPEDVESAHKVTIVNRAFVSRYLKDRNPLGLHLSASTSKEDPHQEIIGVVGDTKYDDLKREMQPTAYVPIERGRVTFELRAAATPEALIPAARSIIHELDSHLPPPDFKTQTEQIDRSLFSERLAAHLSSLFGLLALALACLGLYGLLSYEVSCRTREIGIRTAMGAKKRDVLRLVVGQGIVLVFVGAVAGVAGALGLTRYLQSLLYGVRPNDPATFIGVALLLALVSLAACYIPARRATKVDPMVALRYE